MSSGDEAPPRFWRSLLQRRRQETWGNFSWLSVQALIQSANDQVAKRLDSTIINRRRMRWVAAQRERGIEPTDPVLLEGTKRIVLLGDPGEMDASQYVLLQDLYASKAEALVLMSDIIYPAGNANAWRDAVYLPYFGLPRWDWNAAAQDWLGADAEVPEPPQWQVLATPGNHDWYSGLTGFMFHTCGSEPLPEVNFSKEGLSAHQGLSRSLWQRGPRPDRAILDPLRREVADRWSAGCAPGPMPYQPGPYFTIDLKHATAGRRWLRIVCVDTGVDGSIDVEQAHWLREQLSEEDVPKVLVTGKPLIVNDKITCFPIDGGGWMDPDLTQNENVKPPDKGGEIEGSVDLRDLVRNNPSLIAMIAGDTHNAQRFVLGGKPESEPSSVQPTMLLDVPGCEKRIAVSGSNDLPPLHIVAGGGGAYLSETHHVKFDEEGGLPLRDERDSAGDTSVGPDRHWRFPSRAQSVLMFARRIDGRFSGALLTAIAIGLVGSVWLLGALIQSADPTTTVGSLDIPTWKAVVGAFATAVAAVLTAILFLAKRKRDLWTPWFVIAAVIDTIVIGFTWLTPTDGVPILIGGAALALLIPLSFVILPLIRAYPSARRLVPVRTLVVAAATGIVLSQAEAILIPAFAAILVVAYVGLRNGLEWLRKKSERLAIMDQNGWPRIFYPPLSGWPVLVVVLILVFGPGLAQLGGGAQDSIHLIAATELLLAFVGLSACASMALWQARWSAPSETVRAIGLLAAGVAIVLILVVWRGPMDGDPLAWALILPITFSVALGLVGVTFIGTELPAEGQIDEALSARDAKTYRPGSEDLFRAMAIAAIPGVGQLAESTKPPFHKSFLVVDLLNAQEFASAWSKPKIAFSIFGVDEERTTTQADHPATPPSLDPDGMKLGSYLIDEVIVEFPGTPEGEADDTENAEVPSQGTAGVAAPAARFEVEAGDG